MHDNNTKPEVKASNETTRELSMSEIDQVSGGVYIPLVMTRIRCTAVIRESTGEAVGMTCSTG